MEKERSGIKEVYLIFPNNRESRIEVWMSAGERREIAAYNRTEGSEAVISAGVYWN